MSEPKRKQANLTLREDLRQWAESQAALEVRSLSNFIEYLIVQEKARREADPKLVSVAFVPVQTPEQP